jgi:hypothetical protein
LLWFFFSLPVDETVAATHPPAVAALSLEDVIAILTETGLGPERVVGTGAGKHEMAVVE